MMNDEVAGRGSARANAYGFSGQRAVITGGSQGIGRAVAERLKANGAKVELWDLAPPDGDGFVFRKVDVTDWNVVSDAAQRARQDGGIDVLVCSAGIAGPNLQDLGVPDRRLGPGDARQRRRRLLRLPRRGARHAGAGIRSDRQHRVGGGQGGQPQRPGLFGIEGGGDRPHEVPRQGTRRHRHRGQLRHAGGGSNARSSTR